MRKQKNAISHMKDTIKNVHKEDRKMKKIIICNIPMKEHVDLSIYSSDDKSIPVSERKVRYPINSFLEKTITSEDELKMVLLVKKDRYDHYKKNTEDYKEELTTINSNIHAKIEYVLLETEFEETKSVHEDLLEKIVDEIEIGGHVIADVTYGPKDVLVVLFTALNFAEKHLECEIDNILYGQASFVDGHVVDTKICDMIPLYCLGSVANTIRCTDPVKAKSMLKNLLSL